MADKHDRSAVAAAGDITIVAASEDEPGDYWLLADDGAEFPLRLDGLHDVMHALHQLHDQAHQH